MNEEMQEKSEQLVEVLNGYDDFIYDDVIKNDKGTVVYMMHCSYDKCTSIEGGGVMFTSTISEENTLKIEGEISNYCIEDVGPFTAKLTVGGLVIMCRNLFS